jgi:hypothetical protein
LTGLSKYMSKIVSSTLISRSHYMAGGKYCRRCEYYLSLLSCFVNVAECSQAVVRQQEYSKKRSELRKMKGEN